MRSTQFNTSAQTVNGVTFQAVTQGVNTPWGTTVSATGAGGVGLSITGNNVSTQAWINESGSPFSQMDATYRNLLANGFGMSSDSDKATRRPPPTTARGTRSR